MISAMSSFLLLRSVSDSYLDPNSCSCTRELEPDISERWAELTHHEVLLYALHLDRIDHTQHFCRGLVFDARIAIHK